MPHTITNVSAAMGGALLRIDYTDDKGAARKAYFDAALLRRRTQVGHFADVFPAWLKVRAEVAAVDLSAVTPAALRTFLVGKTINAAQDEAAAKTADGV